MTPYEAAAVFAAFEQAEDFESLMWRVDMMPGHEREIRLFASCSDFFHLATADCEEITADDIPAVEGALADLRKTGEEYYLGELFAARKRKMRPHAAAYKGMHEGTVALFDACATEADRVRVDEQDRTFWRSLPARIQARKEARPT